MESLPFFAPLEPLLLPGMSQLPALALQGSVIGLSVKPSPWVRRITVESSWPSWASAMATRTCTFCPGVTEAWQGRAEV